MGGPSPSNASRVGGIALCGGRLSQDSLKSLYICFAYATSSVLISLVYKALLSSYKYEGKFILLMLQQLVSLAFCFFAKHALKGVPGFDVPTIRRDELRASVWPGLLNVANIIVGWYGMALVNIPLFLCVRRTATAMVLLSEYFIRGRVEPMSVQLSVILVVSGAVIAGWETIVAGDPLGLIYTMMNNVLTAWSHSESKSFADRFKCHGFGIVQYNAITALPVTIIGATLFGEWQSTINFEHSTDPQFWFSVVLASAMGVMITYIVFLCTTVNGPLVTSITGNAKDVVQTILGAVLFHDFTPTLQNVTGILVSFAGTGMFSYIKLRGALADGQREAIKKLDVPDGQRSGARAGMVVQADESSEPASQTIAGVRIV